METKTEIKKDDKVVTISPCRKWFGDTLKFFHIEENDTYFVTHKKAVLSAQRLLLKMTLTEEAFKARKDNEIRVRNALRVRNLYECVVDTKAYIKRWDGILYTATKVMLLEQTTEKLDKLCKKYHFENYHEADAILTKYKRKTK